MEKIVTAGILFFIALTLSAQPTIDWQHSLGGTGWETANAIDQTSDGGYIIAGYSDSNDGDVSGNHGVNDFWLVKLSNAGVIEWEKSLGGSDEDRARAVQQTTDGGYIVVGESHSNDGDVSGNHGFSDYWIVKLTSIGSIEWQKCLGGSGYDKPLSVAQTTDGGYIVAGESNSSDGNVTGNNGLYDYWIVKLTGTGVIDWQKNFGGTEWDVANAIEQTSDGGYIIAGTSSSNNGDVTGNHGSYDYWVVKLTSTGDIFWEKSMGGTINEYNRSIQQTTDGGYIMCGYSYSTDGDVTGNHGSGDYWVIKLTSTGILDWQKALGGSSLEVAKSIEQTSDGGYIVAGYSQSSDGNVAVNYGISDYWLVKLTSTGTIDWQKTLGGTSAEAVGSIQQTTDGGYIIAGWSSSTDIDVTGNHGSYDYWVVKLSAIIGLNESAEQTKLSIYPNPAIHQINVKKVAGLIGSDYIVCDYTGKIVLSGKLNKENTLIELRNLSAGIYVIQIQTVDAVLTSQFVKQQ